MMTEEEAKKILQMNNASIMAPAGYGKTEMISDLAKWSEGRPLLILTHTNAGVEALKKRMRDKGINSGRYKIHTIAAYCIRLCMAYKNTAEIDVSLSPFLERQTITGQITDRLTRKRNKAERAQIRAYYNQMYTGAKKIFETAWAHEMLKCSYSAVVVDEYQDCTKRQQDVFVKMNEILHVYVFGDPLQGIFSFDEGDDEDDKIVEWKDIPFAEVDSEKEIQNIKPYRWENTNRPLGKYLTSLGRQLRSVLEGRKCTISFDDPECRELISDGSIEIIDPMVFNDRARNIIRGIRTGQSSVAFITQFEGKQLKFCRSMGGLLQYDETRECDMLMRYAAYFDSRLDNRTDLALSAIVFAWECFSNVGDELKTYMQNLEKGNAEFGSAIKKHRDFGDLLQSMIRGDPYDLITAIIKWVSDNKERKKEGGKLFSCNRRELFEDMVRSINYAKTNGKPIHESAEIIRSNPEFRRSYSSKPRCMSSRTLLSKGLQFDYVIVDMYTNPLDAKNFYVAMTRAMRKVYIVTCEREFTFGSEAEEENSDETADSEN
ncbi:MAG: UvrD-helicase domain-containing protein [Bacteroidales bacterium]|nr:UvrD-helicase domain-containing protein [Bacteroidales bacterium]